MKLKDLPPLTQTEEDRLAALSGRLDSDIDLGDLPEMLQTKSSGSQR